MRKRWKETAASAVGFGLILLILLAILIALAIFGGSIMHLFGFRYLSVGKAILFFVVATVVSYPINLIAGALPDALYHLNKITRIQAMILYLLLDTGATALGLLCVDYFMDSVSATGISVFVVSLFFALVDIPNHPEERRRTR